MCVSVYMIFLLTGLFLMDFNMLFSFQVKMGSSASIYRCVCMVVWVGVSVCVYICLFVCMSA